MGNLLSSLPKTIHASIGLAIILFIGLFFGNGGFDFDRLFWSWLFRFIHVAVAIMWIGLLWYFNFVQIPNMPKIPDEQKPAIGKVIAPAALFYFRWAALITVISGLILAHLNGYLHSAMTFGGGKSTAIGIGMWLGLYMAFNVWFIIWPNQKKALGIVDCEPEVKQNQHVQQCCFLELIHCYHYQCYFLWLLLKTFTNLNNQKKLIF